MADILLQQFLPTEFAFSSPMNLRRHPCCPAMTTRPSGCSFYGRPCTSQRQSKASRWQQVVRVPGAFDEDDLRVQLMEGCIQITAHREEGSEEEGLHQSQFTRKVSLPGDVQPESVKTFWLSRHHSLVLHGERKQEKASSDQQKAAPRENQRRLALVLDSFGFPHFVFEDEKEEKKSDKEEQTIAIKKEEEQSAHQPETAAAASDAEQSSNHVANGKEEDEVASNNGEEWEKLSANECQGVREEDETEEGGATGTDGEQKAAEEETAQNEAEKESPLAEASVFSLKFSLPEFKRKEIQVQRIGSRIRMSAERRQEDEERHLVRSFTLPDDVLQDSVEWEIQDGQVTLKAKFN